MSEVNMRICKVCNENKQRISDGKYPNSKNTRFINEEGKLWSGNTCPRCLVNRSKENMKKLRFMRIIQSRVTSGTEE